MRRKILIGIVVFLLFIGATFPTDRIVIALLSKVSPVPVEFDDAAMRPWGLRIDGLVFSTFDGAELGRIDSILISPSWWGILAGRRGLPLKISVGACSGTADFVANGDGGRRVSLDLTVKGLDLGCPAFRKGGGVLLGKVDLKGTVVRDGQGRPNGKGTVQLREGRWRLPPPGVPGVDALSAEHAEVVWEMHEGRIDLEPITWRGPEVNIEGDGTIRQAPTLASSTLDLRLKLALQSGAPRQLRDVLGAFPAATDDPDGPRRLLVTGTLGSPRVVR